MADTSILEKCITLGPWGQSKGKEWTYIAEGFIKKIRISYDMTAINSIEFHSECSEGATKKSFFGVHGGIRTDTIIIDYPDEYLTSINGTVGSSKLVTSLCFYTNQSRYGPFGCVGTSGQFSYDGKGGVIVGFYGCFGEHIESIGFYVMPKSLAMDQNSTFNKNLTPEFHSKDSKFIILDNCITLGPRGHAHLGKEWTYVPEDFIKKIRISRGYAIINGIEFQSYCREGARKKSSFGDQDGSEMNMICIDYPDEYLTSLSGTYGYSNGYNAVVSLSFHTNHNSYGPYGNSDGATPFSFDCKGGVIAGFHGHFDKYIRSIGIYMMPKSLAINLNSTFEEFSKPEKSSMMAKLEIPRDVGPWGASGGKAWDDGVFNNIKQVRVQIGDPSNVIFGIQFKYVKKDGKCILSRFHGGTYDGDTSEVEINLDGVKEYLTGISGFYGPIDGYDGLEGITSLTFHTNKGKHGPFGLESERAGYVSFDSTASSGKVVGFNGRSAVGVHMEYF